MPAKYSHVKKRSASGLLKKEKNSPNGHHIIKAPAPTTSSSTNGNGNGNGNVSGLPGSTHTSSMGVSVMGVEMGPHSMMSGGYTSTGAGAGGGAPGGASHHLHHHHQTHSHPAAYNLNAGYSNTNSHGYANSHSNGKGKSNGYGNGKANANGRMNAHGNSNSKSASSGNANTHGNGNTNGYSVHGVANMKHSNMNAAHTTTRSLLPPLPPHLTSHAELRLTEALSAVSQLERAISRLLLLRYDQDIARLFSTHLHRIALVHLPAFVIRVASVAGPGWLAWNIGSGGVEFGAGSVDGGGGNMNMGNGTGNNIGLMKYTASGGVDPGEAVRDWLRTLIGMDLREVGERVATKSVLWSYTALREFAISNNIPICSKTGLHSLRLLPHYHALKAHLDVLEKTAKMDGVGFVKPPHLSSLDETHRALEEACVWAGGMFGGGAAGNGSASGGKEKDNRKGKGGTGKDKDKEPFSSTSTDPPTATTLALRASYTALTLLLWSIAQEFDVRGYGRVLREKLEERWCECGCSTEHLGAVCEGAVREGEVEDDGWDDESDEDGEGNSENGNESGGEGTGVGGATGSGTGKGDENKANKRREAREARRGMRRRKYEAEVDDDCDCERERMEWTRRMKNGEFGSEIWTSTTSGFGEGMGVGVFEGKGKAPVNGGLSMGLGGGDGLLGRGRMGKAREWDGRGSGVFGWETKEEEDVWEIGLDFAAGGTEGVGGDGKEGMDGNSTVNGGGMGNVNVNGNRNAKKGKDKKGSDRDKEWERERERQREKEAEEERVQREVDKEMTVSELMEWRYLRAEREKEEGNKAFRKGDYESAVRCYENAYSIEGEVPHYQLNLAAAHLKLNNWIQAEEACTRALLQHRSSKGLYRRAKARKMLGRKKEAVEDLRAVLRLQPHNDEAIVELASLLNVDLSNLAHLSPAATSGVSVIKGKTKMKTKAGSRASGSGTASGTWKSATKKKSKKANDEYDNYFGSGSGSCSSSGYYGAGGSSSSSGSGSGSAGSGPGDFSSSSGSSSFGFGSSASWSSSLTFGSCTAASSSSSYQPIHSSSPIPEEEEETYDSDSGHAALLRLLGVDPLSLIYTTLKGNNGPKNDHLNGTTTRSDPTPFTLERTKADSKRLRLGFYGASSTSNTLSNHGGPGSGGSGVLNGGLVINGVSVNLNGLEGVISSLSGGGGVGGGNGKLEEVFGSIQRQFEKHQERMGKGVKGKSGSGNRAKHGKPGDSAGRDKRLLDMEKLRKECGVYPGWDRYFVKEG